MQQEFIEKEITLAELACLLNIDTNDAEYHDITDAQIQIETPTGFKDVTSYVVKEPSPAWQLGDLIATSNHRVLYKDKWEKVKNIPEAKQLNTTIQVVDLEVPDGECYNANGWVNHNTTPGGLLN